MIVRQLKDLIGSDRELRSHSGTWVSRRFILKDDEMGFSFHETTIFAGTRTYMWYKHHLEAVYCVDGEGEIEDVETGKVYPITNGTMYALDQNERHYVNAKTDMRLICVFNPPLTGSEDHDENGVYPLIDEECDDEHTHSDSQ